MESRATYLKKKVQGKRFQLHVDSEILFIVTIYKTFFATDMLLDSIKGLSSFPKNCGNFNVIRRCSAQY